MALLSVFAYYLSVRCNRKQTTSLSFYKEIAQFVSESGTPLGNVTEHLSIFLQSTSQYFCKALLFNAMTYKSIICSFNCSEVDFEYGV